MNPQLDLQIELLWYWEGSIDRYYLPFHNWRVSREITCWHLRKGSAELLWEKGSRTVEAGNWIVPPPLYRNEFFSPDAEVQSFRFNAFAPDRSMLLCPSEPIVFPYRKTDPLVSHTAALRTLLSEELHKDLGHKLFLNEIDIPARTQVRLRACFTLWLGALLDVVATKDTPLEESIKHPALLTALHYLAHRKMNIPLREDQLAAVAGISMPHLRRLFRQKLGMTIKEWYSQHLDGSVKQALRSSRYNCKEIAYAHGFSSDSHFSRWFRKRHDCTPKEWCIHQKSDGCV